MISRAKWNRTSLLILSILFIGSLQAGAQAGHLDPTFGTGGIVTTDFGDQFQSSNQATANGVAIQSDGKIVVTGGIPGPHGFPAPAVARYNANGSLDTSFGTSGIASIPSIEAVPLTAVALQSDGSIVAAGLTIVVRYLSTGTLDSTFGTGGVVSLGDEFIGATTQGIAIQTDGKILVADRFLLRLLSNGQFDTTFGIGGIARTAGFPSTGLALLPSGKILVVSSFSGSAGVISQYDSNGSLDTTFGINGQLPSPGTAAGLALLSSGDFLAAGSLTNNAAQLEPSAFTVSRYLGAGVTDATFGTNGGTVIPVPGYLNVTTTGLALEPNSDIVTVGTASAVLGSTFALARYTPTGQVDTTFGNSGTVTTSFGLAASVSANNLAIQSDGKIVVVGNYEVSIPHGGFDTQFKVVRYLGQ
jgi:uncharacterized delta-60 repeat protein